MLEQSLPVQQQGWDDRESDHDGTEPAFSEQEPLLLSKDKGRGEAPAARNNERNGNGQRQYTRDDEVEILPGVKVSGCGGNAKSFALVILLVAVVLVNAFLVLSSTRRDILATNAAIHEELVALKAEVHGLESDDTNESRALDELRGKVGKVDKMANQEKGSVETLTVLDRDRHRQVSNLRSRVEAIEEAMELVGTSSAEAAPSVQHSTEARLNTRGSRVVVSEAVEGSDNEVGHPIMATSTTGANTNDPRVQQAHDGVLRTRHGEYGSSHFAREPSLEAMRLESAPDDIDADGENDDGDGYEGDYENDDDGDDRDNASNGGGGGCVPGTLRKFGVTGRILKSLEQSIDKWPPLPGWAQQAIDRKVNAIEWTQELYVRLLRVLYWRYLLPVDYVRGRSRGTDLAGAALNLTFFPWVATTEVSRKQVGGRCLVWESGAALVAEHLARACSTEHRIVAGGKGCSRGVNKELRTYKIGRGRSVTEFCIDLESENWQRSLPSFGSYDLVVTVFDLQYVSRPWDVAKQLHRALHQGGHIVFAGPSIQQNSDAPLPSLHRWTVEGAKSMFEQAGYCVERVAPLSNMAVTVAGLLGFSREDFTPAELKYVDPVAPNGVAVLAKRCHDKYSAHQHGSDHTKQQQCCTYRGVGIRKVIDCWRGLYGQKNPKSAKDWGCTIVEEIQYHSWNGKAWYQMDWSVNGVREIEGFGKKAPAGRGDEGETGHRCKSRLLSFLGFTERMQQEMEDETALWPRLPAALTGELRRRTTETHLLQELFLRMHRVMYWKQLAPFDINMGWQRGSPLDRVYLTHVFFDDIRRRSIPPGSCLEWGNTYMAGDLKELCPHQYEITEQKGPCGNKFGQFETSSDYKDYRPFHQTSDQKNFKGGYCADIHETSGIIPDNFFSIIICTYVFEHLASPWRAAKNLFDMTAPGGYLIWAAPNMEIYHANPGDYWRYTPHGAHRLFSSVGFCVIRVVPCSNAAVTAGFFMGFGDNDFTINEHTTIDPVAPHTTAVLAMKPTSDGAPCPDYEGIDLGDLQTCWRGDSKALGDPSICDDYTVDKAGWDGPPFSEVSFADGSVDVRS